LMPFVSKYKPSGEFICALTRRQLFGEGVKGINNIARFHKYPHTIKVSDEAPEPLVQTYRETMPIAIKVDNRKAFQELRADPTDRILDIDKRLLVQLIQEYLIGPTISTSVQKKVHAYLLQIMEKDRWFRDNFLGGVPRTDAEVFAKRFLLHTLNLISLKTTPEGKPYRLPVHKCIEKTCEAFAPQS
jgi:hypothetical protein